MAVGRPPRVVRRRSSRSLLAQCVGPASLRRLCLVLLVSLSQAGAARAQTVDEDSVKAVFLTRFAAFVSWPPGSEPNANSPLSLCLLGSPTLAEKVRSAAAVGQPQQLEVVALQRVDRATRCHILFAGVGAEQGVTDALAAVRGQPVLTVTDDRNGESRGVIHFVISERRVRFHIDLEEAQEKRLQLNSRLLGVAVSVRRPGGRP